MHIWISTNHSQVLYIKGSGCSSSSSLVRCSEAGRREGRRGKRSVPLWIPTSLFWHLTCIEVAGAHSVVCRDLYVANLIWWLCTHRQKLSWIFQLGSQSKLMFNLVATIIPALLWGITALHVRPCVLQVNYSLFFRYFVQLYKIVTRISGSKRAVLVRQMKEGTTPASFLLWTGQKLFGFTDLHYLKEIRVAMGKGRKW